MLQMKRAVQRIIDLNKNSQSLICLLIDTSGKLQSYLDEVPDIAWDLIEMTEKPLTIIYSQYRNLATSLLDTNKINRYQSHE